MKNQQKTSVPMYGFMIKSVVALTRMMEWAAALTLALMMLHVLADVIGKQVFGRPAPATTEIVAHYYMIAAVFLPLPFVELRDRSITVDLFYEKFPKSLKRLCLGIAIMTSTFFFAVLAHKSAQDAISAFQKGEMIDGTYVVAIWPARFSLPIAFGLAVLVLLIRFANEVVLNRPSYKDPQESDTSMETI